MPPYLPSGQLEQLHAALDRFARNPRILNKYMLLWVALVLQLAAMEYVLDCALKEPATTPAAKPAEKPAAGPDSDYTEELPGRDDLPKGADTY